MTIGKAAASLAVVLLSAGAGQAQTLATPDSFLDFIVGRTGTFVARSSGRVVGEEYYIDRNTVIWDPVDGPCTFGVVEQRGNQLCFHYPFRETPACWWVFRDADTWMVRSASRVFGAEIQDVTDVRDAPLSCDAAPTS